MLSIKDLSFSYGTKNIINGLNLQIGRGEIASLIGVSGSGKSTLLKLLTNLLKPKIGTIKIENNEPASYMTQNDLLLPWRTVIENVMLPAELGNHTFTHEKHLQQARELLAEMGLSEHENSYPPQLSGGMRQRVSLARALILNRSLLLLDEPFASLDVCLREQMYQLLKSIHKKHNTTILMITHDFRDATSLSNHIYQLSGGAIKKEWHIRESDRSNPIKVGTLSEELRQATIESITMVNN
ncbi:MAG: ABC transporter ATP-binding protein [Chlamydiota bacterium]|nr:ABC transporter ATP-binding protein [Chlamydiota bacterium]